LLRALLARVLPDVRLFRLALIGARLARPVAPLLERLGLASFAAMLRLAPARLPKQERPAAATSTRFYGALIRDSTFR
jgi:hypothetical protein